MKYYLQSSNLISVAKDAVKNLNPSDVSKCYIVLGGIVIPVDITGVREDYKRELMDQEAFLMLCEKCKNVKARKAPYGFNPKIIYFELNDDE